jgi:putative ABC transport system ATP-binding protein
MKEDKKDVVKNMLNEEDLPEDEYNIENKKNSFSNKLIINDVVDLESNPEEIKEENNKEEAKLYLGEISNKTKIFTVLDKMEKIPEEIKPEEDVVVLRNIHKTYLIGIEGVPALRGVSLRVKKGEFLTIFGTSGGGKTTMLNIIGTIDTPSRGDVKIFDKLIKSDTTDKDLSNIRLNNISFVFQSFNLFQNLNVLENVEMPMKIKGKLSYKKIKERALYLIDKVGLTNRINHFPNQLSGGEQQRVTIARALVNSPDILLLDEPTGDLDTKNADIVMSLLLELNLLHGITMIMVTHDVSLKNFGQKIVRVIDGKIHHEIDVPIKDRKECIRQLYERLEKKMGIREGTQSSNIRNNNEINIEENKNDILISTENDINNNNDIKIDINKKENKTVYRKIEDYPIKKFFKAKKSKANSVN